MQNNYVFKSTEKLAKFSRFILWVCLIYQIPAMWGNYQLAEVLKKIQSKAFESEEAMMAAATQADGIQQMFGGIGLLIGLFVIIFVGRWIYRSAANAWSMGIQNISSTPKWGIFYFIIPIVCLYKPYVFMRELWACFSTEHKDAEWKELSAPAIMKIWWASYLLSGIINQTCFRISMSTENIPAMINITTAYQITSIMAIAECILFILIINSIEKRQQTYLSKMNTKPEPVEQV